MSSTIRDILDKEEEEEEADKNAAEGNGEEDDDEDDDEDFVPGADSDGEDDDGDAYDDDVAEVAGEAGIKLGKRKVKAAGKKVLKPKVAGKKVVGKRKRGGIALSDEEEDREAQAPGNDSATEQGETCPVNSTKSKVDDLWAEMNGGDKVKSKVDDLWAEMNGGSKAAEAVAVVQCTFWWAP